MTTGNTTAADVADPTLSLPWRLYVKSSGVRPGVEAKLRDIFSLCDLTIVALIDDSSSMDHQLRRRGDGGEALPFGTTRWSEAALHLEELLRLSSAFGQTRGIDVHFMNRDGGVMVTSEQEIRRLFEIPPTGATPANELLRTVVRQYKNLINGTEAVTAGPERRVLFVLIMDGLPSDGGFRKLYGQIQGLPAGFYLTMVNCNDLAEDDTPVMLWERHLARFHAQSYYSEELRVARAAFGQDTHQFTRAAYVQDMVIGPVFPEDAADIRKRAGKTIKRLMLMKEGILYGADFSNQARAVAIIGTHF
ncbi:hypothetical protein HK405_007824 [Cladochytrium tenue]|nr:hypothetical protein HK405_007824 [Cladochytrium tenue]